MAASASSALAGPAGRPSTSSLAPTKFAQVASGVLLIHGYTCAGRLAIAGTGFLVGRSVVMTARHVVDPRGAEAKDACRIKVHVDGHWVSTTHTTWWASHADPTGDGADLATVRLSKPARDSDYIFGFRNSSPPVGTNLSMLGYPLNEGLAMTQGHLAQKTRFLGAPTLFVKLLGAEGSSGSPLVDGNANVVGILQRGFGSTDVLGESTAGLVSGLDIASWWGSGRAASKRLCAVYPRGGIRGCAAPASPPAGSAGTPGPAAGGTLPTTTTPPATTTPPSTAPSGASPWPPAGLSLWTGLGSFTAGSISYTDATTCTATGHATGCWRATVESRSGCPNGLFVNVDIFNAGGVKIGQDTQEVTSPAALTAVTVQDDVRDQGAARYRIRAIDCYA